MSNSVSFQAPTDYSSEQAEIERRRKYAEMLSAQSMQPTETQTAGGWALPTSWTQHAAKLFQAYSGKKGQEQATAESKALAGKYQTDVSGDTQRLIEALRGRQAQTIQPDPQELAQSADLGTPQVSPVNIPAMSPTESLQAALPSMRTPMGQQMATSYLMEQIKPKELFSKIDPKDYSAESVAKFGQTHNYSDLVPVRKKEIVTLGGESKAVDPYAVTSGDTFQHSPTKDALLTDDRARSEGALNRGVTVRGQDLVNDRSIDQNSVANANKNITVTEGVRKEFENLPEVKNYKQVLPVIESARKAPNTPAGDIDLIYAVGKIMDPNSVVREGELNLVIKAGSPAQRFQGMVNYVQGGGRLSAAQRKELVAVMDSRVGELEKNYDAARNSYTSIVTKQGIDPAQVFPTLVQRGGGNKPDAGVDAQAIADELRRRGVIK
jgi:hypothetical protein